ncbi:MAG: chemotaxis protein CheW [Robiginitomaculum sp.]|nr:chemotaxis protein CheW [Robiginitomaculum sp.]MDQ7076564.1 chemotaxis protein CheW [Robiginitomaculum sp.]
MSTQEDQHIHIDENTCEYVTVEIADQLFGIEVTSIHDVFQPHSLTTVPMAPPEVKGVLNLRGRIVTAIDARDRLGLPKPDTEGHQDMAIGVEMGNESYGLIIDRVGEVLRLAERDREPLPSNIDPVWQGVSRGIYRLDGRLLIILDIEKMLNIGETEARAA